MRDDQAPRARKNPIAQINWAIIDQGLSSGTNFALALVVVRSVTATTFGAFSILVILYVLAIGATRAVITEPMMIRSSGSPDDRERVRRACVGAAFGIGGALGVCCLIGAVLVRGQLGPSLVILGLTFPMLLVQEAGRGLCFAAQNPKQAALNDGCWALLQVGSVSVVLAIDNPPLWYYSAAWLVSGAVAGAMMLWQLHVGVSARATWPWLKSTRVLGVPLFWNFALTSGPQYFVFAITPLVASLRELGLARAAFVPFGVLGILLQSAPLVLLPASSRRATTDVFRLSNIATVLLGGTAIVWGALVLSIPDSFGSRLLGEDWGLTGSTHVAFAFMVLAQAITVGPAVALRALKRPRTLVKVRLVALPMVLVLGVVLTARYGAPGAASAVLAGETVTAVGATLAVASMQRTARATRLQLAEATASIGVPPHDPSTVVGASATLPIMTPGRPCMLDRSTRRQP